MVDDVGGCSQARCHESLHPAPDQGRAAARRTGRRESAVPDPRRRSARSARHRGCRANSSPVSHRWRESDSNVFKHLTKAGTMSRPSPPASRRVRPSCCRPPGCRAPRRCSTPPSCSARSRTPLPAETSATPSVRARPNACIFNECGAGELEGIKRRRLGSKAWQELFRRHAESGEPIGTFCRREGVSAQAIGAGRPVWTSKRRRRRPSRRGGDAPKPGAVTAAPFVDRARSARCPLPRADSRCDWISVGALADPDRRLKVRQAQTKPLTQQLHDWPRGQWSITRYSQEGCFASPPTRRSRGCSPASRQPTVTRGGTDPHYHLPRRQDRTWTYLLGSALVSGADRAARSGQTACGLHQCGAQGAPPEAAFQPPPVEGTSALTTYAARANEIQAANASRRSGLWTRIASRSGASGTKVAKASTSAVSSGTLAASK